MFVRIVVLTATALGAARPIHPPADARAIVRQAMAAIGGDALFAARAIRTTGVQHDYMLGNAERPEGPWRVLYTRFSELRPTGAPRLRRVEMNVGATAMSAERVTVLTDTVVGFKTGTTELGGSPTSLADLLTYVESSPDRALKLAADAPALRLDKPVNRFGVMHDVVSFPLGTRRMSIEISRESHLPDAVEMIGEFADDFRRAALGDVRVRTDYVAWTVEDNGVWWPHQYNLSLNGESFRVMMLGSVSFEAAEPAADSFAVSDSTRGLFAANAAQSPPVFKLGARGQPQDFGDGITRIRDLWTMTAVRQNDGIVLFEAHLSADYLSQVIDYATQKYPGLPIKAIVMSSDPWAHLGGVREAVARGIPIYVNARSIPFLNKVVSSPHVTHPDKLAKSPKPPKWIPVSGKVSIGSGANRIELYPVGGAYAERMTMAYFPERKLLYGSDLVFADRQTKGYMRAPSMDLRRAVEREHLAVDTVFCVQATAPVRWTDFTPAVPRVASADTATVFAPGVVSTGHEFTVTFAPDGHEVYFTRGFVETRQNHVMRSVWRDGAWQPAERVSFSVDNASDLDPALSVDGRRLYFVSTRRHAGSDSTRPDMDIWVAERRGDGWSEPRWIPELGSPAKEGSPTVDRDENLCFFSDRGRESGSNAIFCSAWKNGTFTNPVAANANVNAGPSDTSPWLSPDGNTLLFYSKRAGGVGQADVYMARKDARGEWGPATSLGAGVNTPASEYNPSVSRDGQTLYFGRGGSVWSIPLASLGIPGVSASMFR